MLWDPLSYYQPSYYVFIYILGLVLKYEIKSICQSTIGQVTCALVYKGCVLYKKVVENYIMVLIRMKS